VKQSFHTAFGLLTINGSRGPAGNVKGKLDSLQKQSALNIKNLKKP
jgi:hypothetical protein